MASSLELLLLAQITPGAWQQMSLINSWANKGGGRVNAQYRLLPATNSVEIIGWISNTTTPSGTSVMNSAVPSIYWPASEQVVSGVSVLSNVNVYASSTEEICIDISTGGVFTLNALPSQTTQVIFHGTYSLDA